MPAAGKDTLYIDADDEITAVIEKVVNAKHKVVAVVLPKRATVFQSQVNLKLLKKASKSANKNMVLITSDPGILAIAGSAGVHVAKTPTSKPIIPAVAVSAVAAESMKLDENHNEISVSTADVDEDTIEIDNTDKTTEAAVAGTDKKKKKIAKIPDFSSFKLRMILGISAAVLLIVLWYVGFVVMPQATITINTDVSTSTVDTTITATVGATEVDLEKNTVPATRVQVEKIDSVTVPATGEKNVGNKATGKINLTNCIKSDGVQVVPAGTRFSAGSVTFETSEQAILPEASFNPSGTTCKSKDDGDDKTVGAVAVEPGSASNIDAQSLTSSISGIIAVGSAMKGGTSDIVKVVSASDIEQATKTLTGTSKNQAVEELKKQLQDEGKNPIAETISTGTANVVASPAVNAEAEETKVTMTVTYALIGVNNADVSQILDKEVKKNLGDQPINIRDNGLNSVVYRLSSAPNEADTVMTVKTIATIGPEINQDEIKKNVVGKKRGDIEKQVESIDGVKSVSVEYSPFWITTTPKSVDKITLVFVESDDN